MANSLTLRQLRAFAAVARAGSFTAAAQDLHLTQSALSVLIRELERATGIQLLDRTTRSVRLSGAGRQFLPKVLQMLGNLDGALDELEDLRDCRRGIVRIAAPPLMACTLMPAVIAAFYQKYPDVEIALSDTLPESLIDELKAARVELAVGQDMDVEADVARLELFSDRHNVVCRPDHPLANRQSVRWSDLAPFTFIAPTRDFRARVMPDLAPEERAWLQQRSIADTSFVTTALGMVSAGLGISICPTHARALAAAQGLVMVELREPAFSRSVCVYTLAGRSNSPASAAFVEILRAFVRS